jgi:hypothetical protein
LECHEASKHHLPKFGFLIPTAFGKPWFLTEGKTCYCAHHTFLLGFPTGWLSCPHQAIFLAPLPGKKKISAKGVSHAHPLLCFSFALLYFYLHHFIKNTKRLVSFIAVTLLLLVHYVVS